MLHWNNSFFKKNINNGTANKSITKGSPLYTALINNGFNDVNGITTPINPDTGKRIKFDTSRKKKKDHIIAYSDDNKTAMLKSLNLLNYDKTKSDYWIKKGIISFIVHI